MSKITVERFGKECEMIAFRQDKNRALTVEFTDEVSGYVSVNKLCVKIDGKSCTLKVNLLDDGEYTPRLILEDMTVDLPKIKKLYGFISPAEHSADFVASLSARERRLRIRVETLEKRLNEIEEKVSSRIF